MDRRGGKTQPIDNEGSPSSRHKQCSRSVSPLDMGDLPASLEDRCGAAPGFTLAIEWVAVGGMEADGRLPPLAGEAELLDQYLRRELLALFDDVGAQSELEQGRLDEEG